MLKKLDGETDDAYQERVDGLLKQSETVIIKNNILQFVLLKIASMILKSLKKVSSPTGKYVFRVIHIVNDDKYSSAVKLSLTYDKDADAAWNSSRAFDCIVNADADKSLADEDKQCFVN